MTYALTTSYYVIKSIPNRVKVVQGGTSAGKTIAILLILLGIATRKKKLITITAVSLPHLRRGALRDFKNIIDEQRGDSSFREYYGIEENKSEHTFTLSNGSQFEFIPMDEDNARGGRRDILFINEANLISFEMYRQLEKRTNDAIYLDFNPVNEFWAHTEVLKKKSAGFCKLTYLDNEALNPSIRESLEEERGDGTSNWWRVYGLGEIGSLEGNVYEGWTPVEEVPEGFVLKRYGVDFGYNDPTVVVGVYENEQNPNEICVKTFLYQTKLTMPQVIEVCKQLPDGLFVCDNSQPSAIKDMCNNRLRAVGCNKTPGEKETSGKRYNIGLVQRRKVFYLDSDEDLKREFLTYAWRKKRTGETLDEPQDGHDHAMDAIAYAVRDLEDRVVDDTPAEAAGSYDEQRSAVDDWFDDEDDDDGWSA